MLRFLLTYILIDSIIIMVFCIQIKEVMRLFNSYYFIFLFLPIVLFGYFGLSKLKQYKLANVWLLVTSLGYYAYYDFSYLFMIVATVVINYLLAKAIRNQDSVKLKKVLLAVSVIANIAALAFFKYFEAVYNSIVGLMGGNFDVLNIIFPIGISFYTFQQIAYLVETYREQSADYDFINYALYITYFPKLFSGPIAMPSELMPQFADNSRKKFNFESFAKGLMAFSFGLFQKVVFADIFGTIVDFGYGNIAALSTFEVVLVILGYTLQVYFDFAGYSDMAIGVGLMMNIELPVNFRSPYRAVNIMDFWKRWHITLTNFLTKYVYFSLGGNRKGTVRTYINIVIVFLVSGLWHGDGFTFIIWGLLHGIMQCVTRFVKSKRPESKIIKPLRWLPFFAFINLSWIPFRAPTLNTAANLVKQLFVGGFSIGSDLAYSLCQPFYIDIANKLLPLEIVMAFVYALAIVAAVFVKNTDERLENFKPNIWNLIVTAFIFIFGIISISGVSGFLYTNF